MIRTADVARRRYLSGLLGDPQFVGTDSVETLKAIAHGATAGGCSMWSRRDETTARGLNRCADQHSALAGAALTEWAVRERVLKHPSPADPKFKG